MRKVKIFLIGTFIWCSIIACPVYAAKNPYKQNFNYNGNKLTNCTWYAWQQAYNKAGVALPGWGNASTWYDYAKKAGFEVGKTPKAKSIVVWDWYNNGKNYGHVGYVERTSGDKIYVWHSDKTCTNAEDEQACFENSIDQGSYAECMSQARKVACEYSASYWSSPGDLIGYIYLDSAPKTTTTTKQSTTKSTTEKTTTTKKKSDNWYLSSLDLNVGELEFNKDVTEYEIDVENNVESIEINAKTEDDKAKLDIKDEYPLNEGINEIELVVTAEDGTKASYLIKVNRKEKTQEMFAETQEHKDIKIEKKRNYNVYIALGVGGVFAIILLVTYIIVRRKKNIS